MNAYTKILYQLVFGTRKRQPVLTANNRHRLYGYQTQVLKKRGCFVYALNGVEDHLHVIFELHPTVALSDLVQSLKISSNQFIRTHRLFPEFEGWQQGYGAFTYSPEAKYNLIRYVNNQEAHHRKQSYQEELIELLKQHGVEYDERYLD